MGEVGVLDDDIQEQWIFYAVVQEYPMILLIEDEIPLSRLVKLYSIIQMNRDIEKTKFQYDKKLAERKKRVNVR